MKKWYWCDCCKESVRLGVTDLYCPFCGTMLKDYEEKEIQPEQTTEGSNEGLELKPCPFCGGKAEFHGKYEILTSLDDSGTHEHGFYYEYTGCPKCNIRFYITGNSDTVPEGLTAIKWNTRNGVYKLDGEPIDVDERIENYETLLDAFNNMDLEDF